MRSECSHCYGARRGKWEYDVYVRPEIKKDYCENRDKRLGHKCTATIMGWLQLDMDHVDGNHYNNIPENIQTLCKNCHSWKSHVNEDHLNFMRNTKRA